MPLLNGGWLRGLARWCLVVLVDAALYMVATKMLVNIFDGAVSLNLLVDAGPLFY